MSRFGQAYFGTGARFGGQEESRSPTSRRTMASNELPAPHDRLCGLADDNLEGLATYEVAIDVKQNTSAKLTPLLASARSSELNYGNKKTARKAANAAKNTVDNAAKVFLGKARKWFATIFGESYNTEWAEAGWPASSTRVPASEDDRFPLVDNIRAYLVANPARESEDLGITAALAATLHTNFANARGALTQARTDQNNARILRDEQEKMLRKCMKGLIEELASLLEPDDPRWYAFGLSRPVDEETPEIPLNLVLLPSEIGKIIADWDDALRADRYRVWRLIVGVEADFVPVATVYDSDYTLEGLTTGTTVKVRITSGNDAGESLPGPEAEAVVA
jgi:hypothetical protein